MYSRMQAFISSRIAVFGGWVVHRGRHVVIQSRFKIDIGHRLIPSTAQLIQRCVGRDAIDRRGNVRLGDMLLLNTLRWHNEIRSSEELDIPKSAGVTDKERQMARRLIEDMEQDWKPEKFKDTYRDDLMARIKERIKAGEIHAVAVRALAFQWPRILYRCWQGRVPYDEATYLNALQRLGSSLLKNT